MKANNNNEVFCVIIKVMKKLSILIVTMLILLCGCGQQEAVQYDVPEQMPEIKLTCEATPGEEYTDAKVTASWSEESGIQDISNVQAEVKLRGNSSKEADKKAYNVKFEEELGFLGMDLGKKWCLVSDPFDKSLLRPALGFAYAEALGIEGTPEAQLCKVWLNDEYMGVYTVTEPVEAGTGRVEIDPDNGDFLLERNLDRVETDKAYIESYLGFRFEMNEPEEPDEDSLRECGILLQEAEEAISTSEHSKYKKLIDVDSFVDFYIFNELIKDIDFGEYSTRYYFKDGIMYAGPPWDLDMTMGNISAEKDEDKYAIYFTGSIDEKPDVNDFYSSSQGEWVAYGDYYYWLCMDPWFMDKVSKRWEEIRPAALNLVKDNELGTNLIDRYLAAYTNELEEDFDMYKGELHVSEWQHPADTYTENVEMLRHWISQRIEYIDTMFH